MNPTNPKHPWPRLVAAIRRMTDDRATTAPYGFALRVVALAFSPERAVGSLFERFALRAVGVAGLLALVSVAANYQLLGGTSAGGVAEEGLADDDAVTLLLSD